MIKIDAIDHVALTVRDIERSVAWYQEVLGLERRNEESLGNYPAVVCAGSTCLALFPVSETEPQPLQNRGAITMRHLAIRVNRENFEQAQIELRRRGIDFDFEDHDIAHSIYFHDPNGYKVELTTYETVESSS